MLMKLVKYLGQPLCAALYGYCIYLAAKKKYLPLIILFLTHLTEYFVIGKKTGEENGIKPLKALIYCLALGFTWWLPVRSEKSKIK